MGDVLIESHSDRRKKAAEAAEARARIAAEKLVRRLRLTFESSLNK